MTTKNIATSDIDALVEQALEAEPAEALNDRITVPVSAEMKELLHLALGKDANKFIRDLLGLARPALERAASRRSKAA